ncbi:MAG: TIGR02921 family PEP-CTERM protein [Phormidesmis sp.]
MKTFIHTLSHLVFWVWNLTFLALMYFWCLPQIGFDLWLATRSGGIEPTFIVSFTALMVVPLVCTLLGLFRLRKYPVLLMRLFYGVEAPLFTLCLLRLFLIRELTVASGFALGVGVVAIAMFAIELLSGYSAYRPNLARVQMVSHSVILLVGLYLGLLLLLYSVPTMAAIATAVRGLAVGFFEFGWVSNIRWRMLQPLELLAMFLAIASLLVFVSMPFALVNFYLRAWARIRTAFGQQHSQAASWAITGMTIAISGLLFIGLQGQPQAKAFSLLSTAEPQTQLQNASTIKAGLTNAYLHRYRYLSPWSESNALASYYGSAFKLEGAAVFKHRVQNLHNALLSPFLYRGQDSDVEKAAELYASFFDEPIQQGERTAIRKALQATANRDETKAGLLNLDQKVVRLASQSVGVREQGDWATVEIHERYENATRDEQEIFYTFSLPESAAINGLWLGNAAHPKQFAFVVSPRGAAQQVYNAELERAKFGRPFDPALLEQVGPRQYRLRVFPIPSASVPLEEAQSTPGELELWMTYQVMQQSGGWPLPQLTEKRNIYWTDKTEHLRGDRRVELSEDDWFEAALPAQKVNRETHKVELAEGYQVTAAPLIKQEKTKQEKQIPSGQRFAVVVDTSYSMKQHSAALKQAVRDLKSAAKNDELNFYLAAAGAESAEASTQAIIQTVEVDKLLFYGSLPPTDMLTQFASKTEGKAYDAVLLLTDEGSYELSDNQPKLPDINAPLWIVHVDGKLPSAYEDGLLQKLQASKGGVETSVVSALQRIALNSAEVVALDGYTWKVEPLPSQAKVVQSSQPSEPLEAIAARQLISQQSRTLDASKVAALDGVHAIAKRTSIVTPYSSMLVLVEEQQREALKEAEASSDRFDREVEDGQDELTNPGSPLATSIPEPSQVLGLLVGAIALVVLKRRSTASQSDFTKAMPGQPKRK